MYFGVKIHAASEYSSVVMSPESSKSSRYRLASVIGQLWEEKNPKMGVGFMSLSFIESRPFGRGVG